MDTHEWGCEQEEFEDYEFADYDQQASSHYLPNIFRSPFSDLRLENTSSQGSEQQHFHFVKDEPMDFPKLSYVPVPIPINIQNNFSNKDKSQSKTRPVNIEIVQEPPVEVRTRTPNETRTFSVAVRITGDFLQLGASLMSVSLCYAAAAADKTSCKQEETLRKDILGGTKIVAVPEHGRVSFDNLSICETSTKHKEKEFCLAFVLLRNDGQELVEKRSRSFYAFSHKKVLQRRGSVKLRTLNKAWGKMCGGEQMHVIGYPFIQGPSLSLCICTPHGNISVKHLEYFSESVLFFDLPPYPGTFDVTNDGRTFSNPMEFIYIADVGGLRSRF